MDDLMARTMVENLSIGIDPLTGRSLPPDHICSNEIVQEALREVLAACSLESYASILDRQRKEKEAEKEAKKEQRKLRFPNTGKAWTSVDDKTLLELYQKGYVVPHIANIMKRSPGSIGSRLEKLGFQKKRTSSNRK